jgi:hypothetical protein
MSDPIRATASAVQALANLKESGEFLDLDNFELGLLAYLGRNFEQKLPQSSYSFFSTEDQKNMKFDPPRVLLTNLVKVERLRKAMVAISEYAQKQPEFANSMPLSATSSRIRVGRDQFTFEKLSSKDNVTKADLIPILTLVGRLVNYTLGHSPELCVAKNTQYTVKREGFLVGLEVFLVDQLDVRSYLGDFIKFIDHWLFEAPLPPTQRQIQSEFLESAKSLVLTLKSELAQQKAALTPVPRGKVAIQPFEFRPIDMFAPKQVVANGRWDKANSVPQQETVNIVQESVSESSLVRFSPAGGNASLNELYAETDYKFKFARLATPTEQTIRFNQEVVTWLQRNEREGRGMIKAILMGPARATGAGGLKKMAYDGRFFEVKIKGNERLVLINEGSTWHAVRATDKDHIDREIRGL